MYNTLVLHDIPEEQPQNFLSHADTTFAFAALPQVQHCIGCFGCWTKTPGKCVIKDRCQSIAPAIANCQNLIILSKLTYGGFSPSIKALLDRSIGYMLPFFRIINNEMHHTMRYATALRLTVYFYTEELSPLEQKLATQLVAANAINLGASSHQVHFYRTYQEIKAVL